MSATGSLTIDGVDFTPTVRDAEHIAVEFEVEAAGKNFKPRLVIGSEPGSLSWTANVQDAFELRVKWVKGPARQRIRNRSNASHRRISDTTTRSPREAPLVIAISDVEARPYSAATRRSSSPLSSTTKHARRRAFAGADWTLHE